MEIFTTILLILTSLSFSIYLIYKGITGSKKSMDDIKSGKR